MAAAVSTGILFFLLLFILLFFSDLLVNQGLVPTFRELPARQKDRFRENWSSLSSADRQKNLEKIGADAKAIKKLSPLDDTAGLPRPEQEVLWQAYVFQLLEDRVGSEAAELYQQSLETSNASGGEKASSLGVLAFVVKARERLIGKIVAWTASWNRWMWQLGDDGANTRYLVKLLGLTLFLAILRTMLIFVLKYSAAIATIEAATRIRRAIYHHTFRLGTLAIRALGPSEAVSIFTRQVEAVHDGLYAWLTVVLREPVKFALLVVFALLVNFWMALAFLFFALLVWLLGGYIVASFRKQGLAATHRAANHLVLLQESLMLMRLVKVYLMELFNQARVERQLQGYAHSQLRQKIGEAIYWPMLALLGVLASIVLLGVVGWTVLNGELDVPSAIAQITALVCLYWPLENWLENRRFVRWGREAADTVFKFLDRPGDVGQVVGADSLPQFTNLLEFDEVSLRESGSGRMLLQGVTLSIKAGQRVSLVGPEEMEKHALVYLIPRFLDPTAGEIRIDSHNLRWLTLDSLRAQIAIVLQHNLVFNDSVANNIGCGDPAYTLPRIVEAAKVAHAHNFIQKLPRGYETAIGEMGQHLNIGEQFRIALARAILRDPSLLIIEEPAGSRLDEDTKSMLDDTFTRILPGRTAIFLPHRISTIRNSNRVFLLNKGKIEAAGEHRELLKSSELYQHLHYLEFNMFAGQI